ncbi:hypothetical protein [Streptodolium elevatio]|uniref:Uncharacterized protein n=1 Tax=Streptodolium elevatio TaxID=3157996 RepID=A0ABV3DV64_9ACTN
MRLLRDLATAPRPGTPHADARWVWYAVAALDCVPALRPASALLITGGLAAAPALRPGHRRVQAGELAGAGLYAVSLAERLRGRSGPGRIWALGGLALLGRPGRTLAH